MPWRLNEQIQSVIIHFFQVIQNSIDWLKVFRPFYRFGVHLMDNGEDEGRAQGRISAVPQQRVVKTWKLTD